MNISKKQYIFQIPYMVKHFMYYRWKANCSKNPHIFIFKQLIVDEQSVSKQGIFLSQFFYWQTVFLQKQRKDQSPYYLSQKLIL